MELVKNIVDNRAQTDIGAALFAKRGGETKYSFYLALTNIPATGAANETVDTTVTTARQNTSVAGRSNPGQKECTFMAHRDNYEKLKEDYRKKIDFLQVNPDGTGFKFQGEVTFYQDEVSVGSNLTGKLVITVTNSEELPINNVVDLIQDTATFESAIPALVKIAAAGESKVTVEVDPVDATVTAKSDTESVATANLADKVLTISGVAKGSAIVTLEAKGSDVATGKTHILVIVE
jgi:carbon monoxide dehydrogenase subunit G